MAVAAPPAGHSVQPAPGESSQCSDPWFQGQGPPPLPHSFLSSDPGRWDIEDVHEFISSLPGGRGSSGRYAGRCRGRGWAPSCGCRVSGGGRRVPLSGDRRPGAAAAEGGPPHGDHEHQAGPRPQDLRSDQRAQNPVADPETQTWSRSRRDSLRISRAADLTSSGPTRSRFRGKLRVCRRRVAFHSSSLPHRTRGFLLVPGPGLQTGPRNRTH